MSKFRVGIDVGSTHTDAVIIDENNEIVAADKTRTTPDVTSGIVSALKSVLEKSTISKDDVVAVMFGTTHIINALVQRKGLYKVGVLRLGKPATEAIEPMLDWPNDLRIAVGNLKYIAKGGHEYTGEEISRIIPDELRKIAEAFKNLSVNAIAISSVFSIVNPSHEIEAANIMRDVLGESIPITLSHEIGTVGLLERENATILNAATIGVMRKAIKALRKSLEDLGLSHAKMFFAQNDGTTASAEYIEKYPIFTVVAPISNSIRGAYVLTGITDAIVVDTGGTTSNIGALTKGYPRESLEVEIAGVRTNIRAPDVSAIGIAGGSVVRVSNGEVTVGPESVGYELIFKGIAWGGGTITATDIALAKGVMFIDDPKCDPDIARKKIPKEIVEKAYEHMVSKLEDGIDKIKTKAEPETIILVGGGSTMWPKVLKGAKEVIRPKYAQYANAIGAATALVGATVEKAFSYETIDRNTAINETIKEAKSKAVEAGADPVTLDVAEVEEVAMPYLPGTAVKIRVKVVGKLKL